MKREIENKIREELKNYFDTILNGKSSIYMYGENFSTQEKIEWDEEIQEIIDDCDDNPKVIFEPFLDELIEEGYDKNLINSFGEWEGWSICIDEDFININEELFFSDAEIELRNK